MNAVEAVRGVELLELNVLRSEVVLPKVMPTVMPSDSVEVEEDPIVLALREEAPLVTADDAMLLVRSIANRVARRGSDAMQAQANIDGRSVKAILE